MIRDHVLVGGLTAILFAPLLGFPGSLAFWAANILIDLDHYLRFLQYAGFRPFEIRAMFQYNEEVFEKRYRADFLGLEVFHTAEFIILFGVVAFSVFSFLQPVFWGMLFHIVVDLIHLSRFRMLTKRAHSIIEYFYRSAKFRAQGLNPDSVFEESLKAVRPQFSTGV